MDYGMIGKIEKAKRYAEERDRIHFTSFAVEFNGENGQHHIVYGEDGWKCDCNFFKSRGVCSHTMALERVLTGMVENESDYAQQ
jgi:nuclear transport factor 2 (NTF2) superfamily protein